MEVFKAVSALASQSLKNDGTKEGIVESYNNAIAMMSEDGGPESMDGMVVPDADEDENANEDEDEYADDETNDAGDDLVITDDQVENDDDSMAHSLIRSYFRLNSK